MEGAGQDGGKNQKTTKRSTPGMEGVDQVLESATLERVEIQSLNKSWKQEGWGSG